MDSRLVKALFYIEQNIQSDICLNQVALAAGMSRFHFHRNFKAELGLTPAQHILKTRVLRAAHDLLILSDMTVIDAAFKYGFSSPSVFARSFKKIVGKPPRQFRKDRRAELGLDQDPKVKQLEKAYQKSTRLTVRYLEHKAIAVQTTTLNETALKATYDKLVADKPDAITHAIALFIEPPFGNIDQRQHLIGYDHPPSGIRTEKLYDIPAGYYAYHTTTGCMTDLQQSMLSFRKHHLDPSPYESASTLFFEHVPLTTLPFDYSATERTLYVKVRKK